MIFLLGGIDILASLTLFGSIPFSGDLWGLVLTLAIAEGLKGLYSLITL